MQLGVFIYYSFFFSWRYISNLAENEDVLEFLKESSEVLNVNLEKICWRCKGNQKARKPKFFDSCQKRIEYQNPTKGRVGFSWKNCWDPPPVTPLFLWKIFFFRIFRKNVEFFSMNFIEKQIRHFFGKFEKKQFFHKNKGVTGEGESQQFFQENPTRPFVGF